MQASYSAPAPRLCVGLVLALLSSACSTLPSSGPTAGQVVRSARADQQQLGFRIVDIDSAIVQTLNTQPLGKPDASGSLPSLARDGRNDLIGPGDVLAISIYEVGASLFSGGGGRFVGDAFDPGARGENFSAVVVDRAGFITLPYLGQIEVAGRSPADVQRLIEGGLAGKSQNPQALVAIRTNVANVVYVSGDVRRPGKLDLTVSGEHLLDAIAATGGTENATDDMIVRFTRDGRSVEQRLSGVRSGTPEDLLLVPGDRIELIKRPRTFSVFGATTKVSQVAFETVSLSLAEAVARIGGPNDSTADASAVFLFRYEAQSGGPTEQPVIYRLNMLNPASYFLAQRFVMHDKDVIYIANAAANQPGKLISIINQLFSPFVTARYLAN